MIVAFLNGLRLSGSLLRDRWAAARHHGALSVIVTLCLPALNVATAQTYPPVRILNTHGSSSPSDWTVVTGSPSGLDPRHVVIENGRIRIAHPPTETTERAGHVLYVMLNGAYRLASDPEFGDWTYTGSSFTDPVTSFTILQNSPDVARVRLNFPFHRHEYYDDAPLPVQKTLVLHRSSWGYRAVLEVGGDLPGEREVGHGGTTTHLFSYSNKKGILWNPFNPPPEVPDGVDYEWIRDDGQASGDWWAASLPFDNSFYRMVGVRPPNLSGIRTGQFAGGNTGHLIHWTYEGKTKYEAFIAAVPYDASMARRATVSNGVATVHVPKAGKYHIYTRTVTGRRHTYRVAVWAVTLKAGYNTVKLNGVSLNAPIVAPVSNGSSLPGDIFSKYYHGYFD